MTNTQNPSRRLFLAAGSVGAVFGALGAAVATEAQGAVALAIERQKIAYEAFRLCDDDDAISQIEEIENDSLMALAETPCASDAEFVAKLKYMIERHDGLWGESADTTGCPDILTAIRLHVEARA